jgi:hypothetical protein
MNTSMINRPIGRIDHILSRLRKLWHYYPEHSLLALVMEVTIYANHAKSDFPLTSIVDIEDIAYPEGHLLHHSRNLGMGIDWLEEEHKNEPLPPVPIQTAILGKFAEHWRRQPEMRLGQLLYNNREIFEWIDDDS